MKMEVLSVHNHHIPKQFGVIGSTKVKKDWTSSLTAPRAPSSTTAAYNFPNSPIEYVDVVDGRRPQYNSDLHNHISFTHTYQHQYQNSHNCEMETATTGSASEKGGMETSSSTCYTYNNNFMYCASNTTTVVTTTSVASSLTSYHSPLTGIPIPALTPSPVSSNLSTPTEATENFGIEHDNDIDAAAVNELSQRLQTELRAAKSRHLSCTEVSLPWDLTPRIAADMIKTSEREPCGVRGCAIFIDFEDEAGSARRIASFKVDPNAVSTFELFLTLKQDKSGWTSLLPQFLKNLTRSNTILISPHFTLSKHKLYTCE